jgi:hypothetical protein
MLVPTQRNAKIMNMLKRKDKNWVGKKKEKTKSSLRALSDSYDNPKPCIEVAELKRKFDRLAVDEDEPTSVKKLKVKPSPSEEFVHDFATDSSIESEIEEIGLYSGRTDSIEIPYDGDLDVPSDEGTKKLIVLDSCMPSRDWYRPTPLPRWLSSVEYVISLSRCKTLF